MDSHAIPQDIDIKLQMLYTQITSNKIKIFMSNSKNEVNFENKINILGISDMVLDNFLVRAIAVGQF
jgi:hypothetical protein